MYFPRMCISYEPLICSIDTHSNASRPLTNKLSATIAHERTLKDSPVHTCAIYDCLTIHTNQKIIKILKVQ